MKRLSIVASVIVWGAAFAAAPSHAETFTFSGSAAASTAASGSDLMGANYGFGVDTFSPFTNESWGATATNNGGSSNPFYVPPAGFEATSLTITFSGLKSGTTINTSFGTGFDRDSSNPFGDGWNTKVSGDTVTFTAESGQFLRPGDQYDYTVLFSKEVDNLAHFAFTATWSGTEVAAAVPETSTWAMLIIGFAGMGLYGFRRAQRSQNGVLAA